MRLALLLLPLLVLAACRADRTDPLPGEAGTVTAPPDTAVVSDPLYDPDSGYRPEGADAARAVLLRDADVRDGQVLIQNDTVRVSVVMDRQEERVVRQKAEQFAVLAARELEGGVQAASPETTLGPTRMPYLVVIRDPQGNSLYSGFKAPGASALAPAPAFAR